MKQNYCLKKLDKYGEINFCIQLKKQNLIKARTATLKENNLDFSYYSKIKITSEELGILNSGDEIFNGVVIDDTLGDDEIMVTDYSLRLLRKNNLLSFSTYNECVGSDIHIAYKKKDLLGTKNLKIKKYLSIHYLVLNICFMYI